MTPTPTTFDEASAVLAQSLPNYERRPQQDALAKFIESNLRSAHPVNGLVEAGCGVGKSLGYLIPAILSRKTVVVSTATKALQDQIVGKDLPFLRDHLGVDFTFAILKGRSNYLCQAKREQALTTDPDTFDRVDVVIKSRKDDESFLAEQSDFDLDPTTWRSLTMSADDCPGRKKCPFGQVCFAEKAKARAAKSKIIVVNHALYLLHIALEERTGGAVHVLPDHDLVIFDEAHEIEEYATKILSETLTLAQFTKLAGDIKSACGRRPETKDATTSLNVAADALFRALPDDARLPFGTIQECGPQILAVVAALTTAREIVRVAFSRSTDEKEQANLLELEKRVNNKINTVDSIVPTDEWNNLIVVRYTETVKAKSGNGTFKQINICPIDISGFLRENLFSNNYAFLVSATLSVKGQFDWIANRLGIDEYDSINVGTPFDYKANARIYIPSALPAPAQATRSAWEAAVPSEIESLIEASSGRALLLFTSASQMRKVYDEIAHRLPYKTFIQGSGSNQDIAAAFEADTHSVLFATRSFFTGVDFQGETCSLVVIDKLVFDVPTDPVFSARCDLIENTGGNSFSDYTVPKMVLTLNQAFGRLIRHRNDSGVVAILDSRLITKGYGKGIVKSLPAAPVLKDLSDVQAFYSKEA